MITVQEFVDNADGKYNQEAIDKLFVSGDEVVRYNNGKFAIGVKPDPYLPYWFGGIASGYNPCIGEERVTYTVSTIVS